MQLWRVLISRKRALLVIIFILRARRRIENLAATIAAKTSHRVTSQCMLSKHSFHVIAAKEIVCEGKLQHGWHFSDLKIAIARSIQEIIMSSSQAMGRLRPLGL